MRKKLAESWDGFRGDRRSSPIWPNGASGRSLACALLRLGSIKLACWGFVPSWWTVSIDGLARLVQRSGVAHLQHHRSSVCRVLQLISGNPLGFEGGKGLRIYLGMGRTGVEALRVLQIARRAWNAQILILANGKGGTKTKTEPD